MHSRYLTCHNPNKISVGPRRMYCKILVCVSWSFFSISDSLLFSAILATGRVSWSKISFQQLLWICHGNFFLSSKWKNILSITCRIKKNTWSLFSIPGVKLHRSQKFMEKSRKETNLGLGSTQSQELCSPFNRYLLALTMG